MTTVNNSQLKMQSEQSQIYGCNNTSQDIQLQVIIKDNDSLRRTKIKTSPVSSKKPVTRAQGLVNDDIIKVQYGKIKLNHCRDFRTTPQINNEHSNERVHHPPTSDLSPKKSEKQINCLDSTQLCQAIRNTLLEKNSERTWKLLKWLVFLLFLCIFIALIIYTSVNGLNPKAPPSNCQNSSTSADCIVAIKMNKSVPTVNHTFHGENLMQSSQFSESDEERYSDVTETVFKGSTTLLRPVIVPQLIQANFRVKGNFENGPKNDYIAIERKQNQETAGYTVSTRKQSLYGPKPMEKVNKAKTETLNLLGFTSGHQNNFGVPIEEDERVLRLLNEELIKLEHQREPSSVDSQTESSVVVSPTLPLILHEMLESSTESTDQLEEIQCHSTSLPMCRGILQYDLTSSKLQNLPFPTSELSAFDELFDSNCSTRAAEFVCSALEPECRPTQIGSLQPCKRICKSILEACSSIIVNSDMLTYTFDCDKYPDSNDRNVCEDPTRRRACYENEFKCEDSSCIPSQWQCDNIKDCSDGEDELGCLICNTDEFRCRSNEKCLDDKFRCDLNEDCADGSDERDCESENSEDDDLQMYPRIFSYASFLLPNLTNESTFTSVSDQDRLASGSELNESITLMGSKNGSQTVFVDGILSSSLNATNVNDSKEIMVMSDSQRNLNISEAVNGTTEASHQIEASAQASCTGDQLRCVSGKCITVDQLCDKVMDCPEGEDELMCVYRDQQSPIKKP